MSNETTSKREQAEPNTFTCSHGCTFSEVELEMGMSFATMDFLMEQSLREHEFESDIFRERQLGIEFLDGLSEIPWPWYAEDQWEVQDPQIFGEYD